MIIGSHERSGVGLAQISQSLRGRPSPLTGFQHTPRGQRATTRGAKSSQATSFQRLVPILLADLNGRGLKRGRTVDVSLAKWRNLLLTSGCRPPQDPRNLVH